MERRQVLLVGDDPDGEFAAAVNWLHAHTALTAVTGVEAAAAHLEQGPPPDMVLLAQARPGQFTRGQVERLHRASPVSRLVALLGTWCEGETRSGRPWPGVVRIYWHQWRVRLAPALEPDAGCTPAWWSLPRTATAAEQVVRSVQAIAGDRRGRVAIHARSWSQWDSLSDVCRLAGYTTAWLDSQRGPPLTGVTAVLWDAAACGADEVAQIRECVRQFAPAPVMVLLDFVRREDDARALAAGAAAVLAKPFQIADLLAELDRMVQGRG